MNELQVFTSNEFGEVRTVVINDTPWFVGKDVAVVLGYQNSSRDINRHVDEEDRQNYQNGTFDSPRGMTVINESGLYSLILSSKLPKAKEFKRWVTTEVLPAIRRHGAYMTEQTLEEALSSPEFLIKLATELKDAKDTNKKLEAVNANLTVEKQIMQPKADYFDELVDRNLLTNFRETAKQLHIKQNDFCVVFD